MRVSCRDETVREAPCARLRARPGLSHPGQCALAGRAALWEVLAGVAEDTAACAPTPSRERAAAWARAHAIAGFTASIGDVDPQLPGGCEEIDRRLRRDAAPS